MPRSLNLSLIDTPIYGIINDSIELDDEWEDKISVYQIVYSM